MIRSRAWRWSTAIGGGVSGEALLAAADVRFDFSQYTDINDMVDVNGGWGPIDVSNLNGTPSFTVDGLRLVGSGNPNLFSYWRFDSQPGPLIMGAAGTTILAVVSIAAPIGVGSGVVGIISRSDMWGDDANTATPELTVDWQARNPALDDDLYGLNLYDTDNDVLVDQNQFAVPDGLDSSVIPAGVFVAVAVVDVDAAEMRVSLVNPDGRFDTTVPFAFVANFPALERALDSLYCQVPNSTDATLIEWDGWNQAFTSAEVDALVAHFIA